MITQPLVMPQIQWLITAPTALVTGGARGVGRAVVATLRARGWNVIAPTRAELDFDDAASVESWAFNNTHAFNAIVFCHGTWYSKSRAAQRQHEWSAQYQSRVILPLYLVNSIAWSDSVTMVASTRGFIGGVNTGPYSAACAAQIALVQGYAREQSETRWNCVCPGLTDTDMARAVRATGGAAIDAIAQPAQAVADEVVRLIVSDDNGKIMRVVNSEVSEAKWSW